MNKMNSEKEKTMFSIEDDGLKAFAMLMAVANSEESMLCRKTN